MLSVLRQPYMYILYVVTYLLTQLLTGRIILLLLIRAVRFNPPPFDNNICTILYCCTHINIYICPTCIFDCNNYDCAGAAVAAAGCYYKFKSHSEKRKKSRPAAQDIRIIFPLSIKYFEMVFNSLRPFYLFPTEANFLNFFINSYFVATFPISRHRASDWPEPTRNSLNPNNNNFHLQSQAQETIYTYRTTKNVNNNIICKQMYIYL